MNRSSANQTKMNCISDYRAQPLCNVVYAWQGHTCCLNISHFVHVHPNARQPGYSMLSLRIHREDVRYNMTAAVSVHKQECLWKLWGGSVCIEGRDGGAFKSDSALKWIFPVNYRFTFIFCRNCWTPIKVKLYLFSTQHHWKRYFINCIQLSELTCCCTGFNIFNCEWKSAEHWRARCTACISNICKRSSLGLQCM